MVTTWRPVVWYEGLYEVSDAGIVKSLSRLKTRHKGKVLKESLMLLGYKRVAISRLNKPKYKLIHRLVAEAFLPNPLNKPHVNHIDSNPSNNSLKNLEWCTPKENTVHALKNGAKMGSSIEIHPFKKLTQEQVSAIRTSTDKGVTLAKAYGVTPNHIYRIKRNEQWKSM